ncbi:hypothetical protein GCM10007935_04920 [Hydrogenophaga electricum]|uniref:Uncharacterized protein n=1 Tax=Hydrogenophaga electricum TaxID=1230953 RepID=A0ABQ6C240_9BURK|nr:hypothetical protein GCM10007935_04920 [Hydrogenophaga electricum]
MPSWPEIDYFHANAATARGRLAELEHVAQADWYDLYRHKHDGSLWRVDREDKYQGRFIVRVPSLSDWESFDSSPLEKQLLLSARGGESEDRCLIAGCSAKAIKASAFCLEHTYERGVRK